MRDLLALQVVLRPYAPAAWRANQSLIAVQLRFQKYSASRFGQINSRSVAVPFSQRGALRGRHERWARDAVDARARLTIRAFRGRRSRVVLTPRRWRQVSEKYLAGDGGKKSPVTEEITK